MKRRGVSPTSDAKQHLQVTTPLFEVVYGFEVPVEIIAALVPRVARMMDVLVGPYVGQEHLTTVSFQICKRIEDVTAPGSVSGMRQQALIKTYVRSWVGIKDGGNFRP